MMRLFGGETHNTGFNVSVSGPEVRAFNARWPCSQLPNVAITFCFDSRGDLVDILPYRLAKKVDGPEAVALCDDARKYAESRRPHLKR